MSSSMPARSWTGFEQLRLGRDIVRQEGEALVRLARQLDEAFCAAATLVANCRGNVLVSGMGKAGLIGQKIAATLASTGTRSFFLHPAEAVHGDLGRVHGDDVALVLSQSGETAEVIQILPSLKATGATIIAITGRATSALAKAANTTISIGVVEEACPLGLAPSTSTAAMLAVGDALALVVSQMRGFRREDFARNHPGGSLGRHLTRVDDAMRPLNECRVAREDESVRQVFVDLRRPGRRSGAIMLVDASGKLRGIFTDSDLARLFENKREAEVDGPISRLMTRNPKTIVAGTLLVDAVKLMAATKISELPVVDASGAPLGMVDVTDIVPLLPDERSLDWFNGPHDGAFVAANVAENFAPSAPASLSSPADDASEEIHPPTVPFANREPGASRT